MELELVRIFVKVVRTGGFSRAAESLRLPKSTVSKAVARLESETGTRLLLRTTRSLSLTAAGKVFYDTCVGPVQALEEAQKSLIGTDSLLTGTVAITAPEDLGTQILAPAMAEMTRKYPGLNFELLCTDEVLDLVKDGIDLAIRIGGLKESRLRAKRIGDIKLIPVASPDYLRRHGSIQRPEDLSNHAGLTLTARTRTTQWALRSKTASVKVAIRSRIVSNQMSSLLRAALSDAGVALVPAYLCRSDLEAGRLVRLVPQWTSHGLPVSLLSPLPFSSSARLRMVADQLGSRVGDALKFNT